MSHLFQTYGRWNVEIKEAAGSWAVDTKGKKYLDFIQGIAVTNLGHNHPKVKQAIKEQLDHVWHVSNLFENGLQEKAAEKLAANSSGDLVFFCNSGAEANEGAIKLARKATGKTNIVTFLHSFHGRTYAGMAATGQDKIKTGFGPMLEGFHYVPFNDREAMSACEVEDVAAVMLEVVQGEGGVNPATVEFLKAVQAFCEKHQALLIVDEIQTGIGRTGTAFAYEQAGLDPDIISVAKGLGNGFPVGAVIGKKALGDAFSPGSHGTTFGGNMLAMSAVNATLDVIFKEDFLSEVKEKGAYLLTKLQDVKQLNIVKEVRGKGLMAGIECHHPVGDYITALREQGLLVLPAGPNVIRLLPPLNVEKAELDQAIETIIQVLANETVTV
ncbi:acetylornithine transaminase [Bacillus pumilus]|uniref:Acetylornithine aminotransferase n=1 Tax=Bacillus pumilus TaxID=1408 RepID=A0A2A5IXR8_BACPU|nr:acetylornithine transaminase [Bacillus pumilus]PCK22118.1 acetylornithine transaminase [Bacillus pumilus]